jgi:hypothetical protein
MLKVTSYKLQPGMQLARRVINKAGITLLCEGTELTESGIL